MEIVGEMVPSALRDPSGLATYLVDADDRARQRLIEEDEINLDE
jgi:hypothetical protein